MSKLTKALWLLLLLPRLELAVYCASVNICCLLLLWHTATPSLVGVCVGGNTVYMCEVTLCVCEVTLCMCVCVFPFVVRPSRLFHPHFILVISAMF